MAAEIPDRPVKVLAVVCGVLLLADFLIDRHPHVPGEAFPLFYAIAGFLAFTLIVLGAKQLRRLIRRDEAFYAPDAIDAEAYPDSGLDRLDAGPSRDADPSDTDGGAVR